MREQNVILSFSGISKTFAGSVKVLENIEFDIRDNELFTLLGPSGCGKTTLLRIIAGFETPTTGSIKVDGRDIGMDPPFRRPINTMFQSYALFPHLNVRSNIAYGLEMLKWDRSSIKRRVDEVLDLVQMSSFADRRVTQMSGGQQQRIALARALAPKPRVLLLDEPLSALDLKLRKAMQSELKRLQKETSLTFVMVTHDQEEALALSDRIAVMHGGKVQQLGTPSEIYARPANKFVADFIGEANLIPGSCLAEDAKATFVVRPEQIAIGEAVDSDTRGTEIKILSMTFLGADTLVEGILRDGTSLRVRQRGLASGLTEGADAKVRWSRSSEWVLRP